MDSENLITWKKKYPKELTSAKQETERAKQQCRDQGPTSEQV